MSRQPPPKLSDKDKVAVAVSGGSDSLALLFSMAQARGNGGPSQVLAVTVDHGLRDEAAGEAALVAKYCREWEIPHTTLKWEGWDGSGNLQDAARNARYRLIAEWALENGVAAVLLGHTQNDLAETFLMQLGRKAGIDGLTSMTPAFERNGVWFHRPHLSMTRLEGMALLDKHGIEWVDDPSNEDTTFQRVRVRSALGPLDQADISVGAIAEVARNLGTVRETLHVIFMLFAEQQVSEDRGDVTTSVRSYMAMPPEFRRMFLQFSLHWVAGGAYPPRMRSFKKLPEIEGQLVPFTAGGCIIQNFLSMPIDVPRRGGGPADVEMRITREFNAIKDTVCATNQLWDGRWALEGPHDSALEVRALGEAVKDCPDWRETGMPRTSLLSSPAIWRGNELISAPLAGFSNGWTVKATGRGKFAEFLLSR